MRNQYPFTYTVVLCDNLSGNNQYVRESGMAFCSSYADAAAQIEEYYGEDLLSIKHLMLLEETSLIILPEQTIKDYVEAEYCDFMVPCRSNGDDIIYVDDEDLPF